MVDLDEISSAFTDDMEVDAQDMPVVSYESLGDVLETIGLAASLAGPLAKEMDPEGSGYIHFEPFVNTVANYLADNEDNQGDDDCRRTFDLLKDPATDRITQESLEAVAEKLKFGIESKDLEKMLQLATSKGNIKSGVSLKEFAEFWRELNNMFGAEVGP